MANPNTDAPKDIRDFLVRKAGRTPFGTPNWRVCLAQNVVKKRGGLMHRWPSGNLSQFTLGADYRLERTNLKPDSVTSGVVEVPRYRSKGWIMERWMPAHIWGSREQWESQRGADGSPLLGPFPHEGDYWMICGPFEHIPELGDMEEAISRYEYERDNRPVNLANAISQSIRSEEDERIARYHALIADLEHLRRDGILPVLKSTSLAAQAVRQDLNKQLGISSHSAVM